MKGAPPKVSYFEKLIPALVKWGITGVLLEWEDTFPYSDNLKDIGFLSDTSKAGDYPYSYNDAQYLISLIENHGLTVIPLIQTFGHMEFVLKHQKWYNLREVEKYPSSICPMHPDTLPLIKEMLNQVITFHKNSKHIHIGCDEVWHMGLCDNCSKFSDKRYNLFLNHLTLVAQYIKTYFPDLTIIIWDDMIRSIPAEILKEYNIGSLVEPMVWCYLIKEDFNIGQLVWEKYKLIFNSVWVASAFKGATSSCQIIPDKNYHLSNHQGWLNEITNYSEIMPSFKGITFTGWSRFDHYATLCELLPVGIPSLAICLKTWLNCGYSQEILESISNDLGFNIKILYPNSFPTDSKICDNSMRYPGCEITINIEELSILRHRVNGFLMSDLIQTWLNSWQIKNNYTNPMQIENLLSIIHDFMLNIQTLENNLKNSLNEVYYPSTVKELLGTLIEPMKTKLLQVKEECECQLSLHPNLRALKL